jgi:hypothetical protein
MGLLGDSGMKLAHAGVEWFFERKIAEELIEKGIAIEITGV